MAVREIKTFLGVNELKNYRVLFKQLFAEYFATFFYMTTVLLASKGSNETNVIIVAASNGVTIATVVQIFGHVSGCHINPAVTVGAFICGHIKPLRALCYVAVQIGGSITGSMVAHATSTDSLRGNLGVTLPHKDSRIDQIFAIEFIMTFLLVAVILSVIDTKIGARGLGSAPLAIGVCLSACLFSCLPYTGSLNPIRTLGPAVVMNEWRYHWVYWVAPMLGGFVAGIVYRCILSADDYTDYSEE